MKKTFALLCALIVSTLVCNICAFEITKVDKVQPTDELFMDMAVSAAKKSMASNTGPSGAVIILNGAWRATGTPEGGKTPEEAAFAKSRLSNLKNAVVYTVNEPTTATVNLLNELGVGAIYFTNPREAVVAVGIYPASAYDDSKLNTAGYQAPVYQLAFPEASLLLR